MINRACSLSVVLATALVALAISGCATQSQPRLHDHPVDFSGFWELGEEFGDVIRPENDEDNLTDEAKARIAEFHQRFPEGESKWPLDLCFAQGMPWAMLARARTYSNEIVQTQNRIFLVQEGFDQIRDIHLDKTGVPHNFGPSNTGYSTGRWEADVLVIETGGLVDLNDYSDLQRSGDAHITERWHIETDENGKEVLITELWVTDVDVYKKPGYGRKRWRRMPEGTVVSGYNCNNSLWDDFVAEELSRQEAAGAAE